MESSAEAEVAVLLQREYRRRLLHDILDSLIRDVERQEREGVYLFDWNISASERGPLRPLEEIEDET
jgi:hypothetical protein